MDDITSLPVYSMKTRAMMDRVMITKRPADARGHADHGWLDSHHTFSFADYHDPAHMGFRNLRVINEDRVEPGRGFGTHPHRDMEIVLEGGLEHRDSMGTGSVIRPGDVQVMSAGTGVSHSEFNASRTDPVHFLQIWLLPERRGLKPGYQQRSIAAAEKDGRLRLVASRDGHDDSVTIHSDVAIYAGLFAAGQRAEHPLATGRHAWVHVARGHARVNGRDLAAGDALALSDEPAVVIEGTTGGEVLVFDLG
jgi:redox-sensitive bicupin YhaK (pirin superfamily)